MNLETKITTMQAITRQAIDRFRQEQWRRAAPPCAASEGWQIGDRETFILARARAETFLERARWAFPIAVEVMGQVADAMGWPWITPQCWKWTNVWSVDYYIGYAKDRALTASVGVDVWGEGFDYEPDWVPRL